MRIMEGTAAIIEVLSALRDCERDEERKKRNVVSLLSFIIVFQQYKLHF
jgi:hypothetical protein